MKIRCDPLLFSDQHLFSDQRLFSDHPRFSDHQLFRIRSIEIMQRIGIRILSRCFIVVGIAFPSEPCRVLL